MNIIDRLLDFDQINYLLIKLLVLSLPHKKQHCKYHIQHPKWIGRENNINICNLIFMNSTIIFRNRFTDTKLDCSMISR